MKSFKQEDFRSYDEGVKIAQELFTIIKEGDESPVNSIMDSPEIVDWIENNPYSVDLIETLCSEKEIEELSLKFKNNNPIPQIERFYKTIERKKIRRRISNITLLASGVAAAIILFFNLIFTESEHLVIPQIKSTAVQNEITHPTLILNTGEIIKVDEKSYSKEIISISENIDPVQYNKLVVPPKSKFKLELEDGSVVHLNADSELSYPINFSGDSRKIILHRGEAYIEVVKSSKSFEIEVDNALVKVYGTKFNINNYSPDIVQTLLVEGSLGVSLENKNETIINPGELISLNKNTGDKTIEVVNSDKYLTWVNGFLRFDEEPLSLMLEQIARWYGVEFRVEKNVNVSSKINAFFSIERPLEEIFKSIKDIAGLEFIRKEEGIYIVK